MNKNPMIPEPKNLNNSNVNNLNMDDYLFINGLYWGIGSERRTKRDYVMRLIRIVYENTLSPEQEKLLANDFLAQLDEISAELEKSGRYRKVQNSELVDFWKKFQ